MSYRTEYHVVRKGTDIIVLGTDDIQKAARLAGINEHTHRWGGSYPDDRGWILHKDGDVSYRSTGCRPGVMFCGVRERDA